MERPSKEEIIKLLDAYANFLKMDLDFLGDSYPADVQDAYKIFIRYFEILADPKVTDLSVREAISGKIPEGDLEWALKIVDRWSTRHERKAKARKREKERRERNKGKLEERKLTEKKNQELYEKFETMRILRAVDELDKIRPIISDQFNPDGFPKPPELRNKLLKLHEKAHTVINEYDCDTDQGMFDLAWEIEEEISEAVEYLEAIRDVIDELVELTPSEEDEFEDNETD